MNRLLDVPAPAKLNLFLHVVGQRPDGYHLLQSAFMLIDWADTLHFERRRDGQIRREDVRGTALPEADLVVRAARALQQASGCPHGADIVLDKQLPMEAGLGGGSSDAASTLLALNQLWGLHWPLARLLPLGATLGADVPFFLGGHNAWVEGIGERLTPLTLPPARFLVLKPPSGVATPQIFQSPCLKRDEKHTRIEDFVANNANNIFGWGRNNLQPVASALCPDIETGLQWMQANGLTGRMTGSGSALFAPVQQPVDLSTLPTGWIAKICTNLKVHPLNGWC
ncbi:4-(cytidine 5'-diphospho)-2-C-methyl-D-erythritol kinase [Aquabacterium sp. A08]|uniref:4-(cytidine 5'-diphospho)-2-C-methyl-D-erythritol kinase n=1 Tax=Aquabacterium sp. A08 TaxID=2718532 RepID=UPI001424951E|nr:4-(cytidine 5'-diphospho)-2-C-methyl-D-erythritol kinase [Aquabacterium sp. A08]NIC42159.1 4-(cytidine 5'-diphospho)-2-C-methyl-D-erythritol kinase [Aquabacterium sp. A08]